MRHLKIFVAFAVIAWSGAAAAQTPTTMIAGTANLSFVKANPGWCALELGPSTFQRSGTGPALITTPDVVYSETDTFVLSGESKLTFETSNGGRVDYLYKAAYSTSVRRPHFSNYVQTYDAAQGVLKISYVIRFPTCNLPVAATYRN